MTQKSLNLSDLTPAQTELMEIIWERGEVSAADARRILAESRPVAATPSAQARADGRERLDSASGGRPDIFVFGSASSANHDRAEGPDDHRHGLRWIR